jgi:hypothetical protein
MILKKKVRLGNYLQGNTTGTTAKSKVGYLVDLRTNCR